MDVVDRLISGVNTPPEGAAAAQLAATFATGTNPPASDPRIVRDAFVRKCAAKEASAAALHHAARILVAFCIPEDALKEPPPSHTNAVGAAAMLYSHTPETVREQVVREAAAAERVTVRRQIVGNTAAAVAWQEWAVKQLPAGSSNVGQWRCATYSVEELAHAAAVAAMKTCSNPLADLMEQTVERVFPPDTAWSVVQTCSRTGKVARAQDFVHQTDQFVNELRAPSVTGIGFMLVWCSAARAERAQKLLKTGCPAYIGRGVVAPFTANAKRWRPIVAKLSKCIPKTPEVMAAAARVVAVGNVGAVACSVPWVYPLAVALVKLPPAPATIVAAALVYKKNTPASIRTAGGFAGGFTPAKVVAAAARARRERKNIYCNNISYALAALRHAHGTCALRAVAAWHPHKARVVATQQVRANNCIPKEIWRIIVETWLALVLSQ